MSSAKEEILKQAVSDLNNTVNSIMLDINLKLSKPENVDDITSEIYDLIMELSTAEHALTLATNLWIQSIPQKTPPENTEIITPE